MRISVRGMGQDEDEDEDEGQWLDLKSWTRVQN